MHEGRLLSGRYRLLSKLGQGGMGSVWRAEHVALQTIAAVKLIDPSIAESAEALARFEREAQAAASLRSANVVQILDYGVDEGLPYIVMELLDGESLADRLERVGRLAPAETAAILVQLAKAMTRAHEQQIVHRDLKPDNVFLTLDGDEEIAKVLDFGIAKSRKDGVANVATQTGAMLGTPYYMSPEQAVGQRAVDHRTDIWAFAIIAVECITGVRPFDGETIGGVAVAICVGRIPRPSELGPVPQGFDEWFARCTDRDPNRRYQSMKEAAAQLQAVCAGVPAPLAQQTIQLGASGAMLPALSTGGLTPWNRSESGMAAPLETAGAFSGTSPGLARTARSSLGFAVLGGAVVAVVALGAVAFVLMGSDSQPDGGANSAAAASSTAQLPGQGEASAARAVAPSPAPAPSVSASAPEEEDIDAGPAAAGSPEPRPRVRRRQPAPRPTPKPSAGTTPPPKLEPTSQNLDDLVAL